jgi:diadenosine tetraphosphate (Ap4A) HIT family hydrolase
VIDHARADSTASHQPWDIPPSSMEQITMSKWTDPGEWESLVSGVRCPFCLDLWGTIAELRATFLTAHEAAAMPGYCCLILKRHAIELHDLAADEASQLMQDIQQVSRAVQQIMRPIKLNYEIHGNTVPHLHVHVFPRYQGDRFEHVPINPRIVTEPVYQPGEFAAFVARLRTAVQE